MKFLRKLLVLIICFGLPIRISFWLLNLLGNRIHSRAKVGFSLIWIEDILSLGELSRIGNFNVVRIGSLRIGKEGYIGRFNNLNGPFELELADKAALGNGNKCYRAPLGVTYGKSVLKLGILTKLTAGHRVDCTRSITIGDYSILAGNDSQLWTHGYYHDKTGPGRFRLDGDIVIGNNVYIGSRCVITGGVTIADNVVVGANTCVSKSLLKRGTYVNQPLRFIEAQEDADLRSKFEKIKGYDLCEEVYQKKDTTS